MGEKETATAVDLERKAAEGKKTDAERSAGSPPRASQAGMPSGREAGGGADTVEAAINNSHSNIKNLRETGGGIEHEDDWTRDGAAAVGDTGGGADDPEAAINNTKSNIKNRESGQTERTSDQPRVAQQGFRSAPGAGSGAGQNET